MTTVAEIINQSIAMHPTLYAEALTNVAHEHRAYAHKTHNLIAHRTAMRLAAAAFEAASMVRNDQDAMAMLESKHGMDNWLTALNVAARLQCIPHHVVADAVEHVDAKYNKAAFA